MTNSFTRIILLLFISACSNQKPERESDTFDINASSGSSEQAVYKASTRVDLKNKGIGPISTISLPETIDEELAGRGVEIYNGRCIICHKPDEKFIGPAPKGILERRTPEWVMNMILNPEVMLKEDPLAKELFMEFNGSPMANQNLTEDEARAVLEYFRTL